MREAPIPENWSTATVVVVVIASVLGALALIALVVFFAWPWRVEATFKARTRGASEISVAGGLELFGFSGSAAAIFGGPGVVAVHLRARELWRRPIAHVSVDSILDWLSADEEPSKRKGVVARAATRAKDALLARTDVAGFPELAGRVFMSLRDTSMGGSILFGSSNPVVTGKTAAWLYPIASLLAPFGTLEVSFDWTGRNILDGGVELSFRVVPARVVYEGLRFAQRHVHRRRILKTTTAETSVTQLPASSTT